MITKVIGPPGTGKTTYLLRKIEEACKYNDPERIGAVSYTNAAVEEMRDRIAEAGGIPNASIQNVRTIHSHCFRMLELDKEMVAEANIEKWNEEHPKLKLPVYGLEVDENTVCSADTNQDVLKMFALMNIKRNMLLPVEEWKNPNTVCFYDLWQKWLDENNLIDFTGMLEQGVEYDLVPDIDVLFVDEAQDLTPLQFKLMSQWSQSVTSTMFAGDGDQAIYRWAGADPGGFINLEFDKRHVLEQSYRVPRRVHEYAQRIIRGAKDREDVMYHPTDREGSFCNFSVNPLLKQEGSHMIIARCNWHLNRWKKFLIERGVPWHNPYRPGDRSLNPTKTKRWEAALTYLKIKQGKVITAEKFRDMINCIVAKGNLNRGVKRNINDYVPESGKINYSTILGSNIFTDDFLVFNKPVGKIFKLDTAAGSLLGTCSEEEIVDEPRVVLGTIHSVKGGEADNVWIDISTAARITDENNRSNQNLWDEMRVGYVAATRAKESLTLLGGDGTRNEVFVSNS